MVSKGFYFQLIAKYLSALEVICKLEMLYYWVEETVNPFWYPYEVLDD